MCIQTAVDGTSGLQCSHSWIIAERGYCISEVRGFFPFTEGVWNRFAEGYMLCPVCILFMWN